MASPWSPSPVSRSSMVRRSRPTAKWSAGQRWVTAKSLHSFSEIERARVKKRYTEKERKKWPIIHGKMSFVKTGGLRFQNYNLYSITWYKLATWQAAWPCLRFDTAMLFAAGVLPPEWRSAQRPGRPRRPQQADGERGEGLLRGALPPPEAAERGWDGQTWPAGHAGLRSGTETIKKPSRAGLDPALLSLVCSFILLGGFELN